MGKVEYIHVSPHKDRNVRMCLCSPSCQTCFCRLLQPVLFSPISPAFAPSWSSSLVHHVATLLYGSLRCLQMLKIHSGRRAHEFNIGVM